jgi:hypothetical protein
MATFRTVVPVLLLSAFAVAGCQGGGSGGGSSPTEPQPLTLTVSANPGSIGRQGVAQLVVQAQASGGASVAGLPIVLTTTLGQLDRAEVVTDATGRATAELRGTGASGTARVTAQLQGRAVTGIAEVRIGLDRSLRLRAQPTSIAGGEAAILTAIAFEADERPVPAGTPVTFSTDRGVLTATTVPTDAQGVAQSTLRTGGTTGVANVAATVQGAAPSVAQVTLRQRYAISLEASPGSISSSGRATVTVRVLALDPAAGVNGLLVQLAATRGRLGAAALRTNARGIASTTLDGAGDSGTAVITATLPGQADAASATVSIGGGATVRLTASPAAVPADGGASTLTVLVFGSDGAALVGVEVQLVTTRGRLDATRVRTDGSGLATTLLRGDGRSGAATVTGTLSGTAATGQVIVTFT